MHGFRRQLLRRLLFVSGLVAPASAACTSEVVVVEDGGGGSGGAGAGSPVTTSTGQSSYDECFDWPQSGTSSGGGFDGPSCPNAEEAKQYLTMGAGCGYQNVSGPWEEPGKCCYEVQYQDCLAGRPYVADGAARHAAVRHGGGRWNRSEVGTPRLEGLSTEARALLAELWARDGIYEHASVASFGRFALELLAVGAPPELVAEAHAAALDEVRHARACLALASAYAGEPMGPGAFPFEGRVEVSASLAEVAARAAYEGCVGETLAAIQAAEQLELATDPTVRAALAMIARDEARHAELAWRTVAWAIEHGGAPVRRAVEQALRAAMAELSVGNGDYAEANATLASHGRLDAATARHVRQLSIDEVIRPCVERLLAATSASLMEVA
jgi:hypothetical protein